ncbi:ATP-grasp domain-containing protein [Chondromyces crocatus]|uniref:ATP-grasp domain-containing protein n=1 Tax=Chondromyces crocatus TaxID=52 RepID=UPI00067E240F|nr:hypothetical protein [Chondromyces crocatus]
MRIAFVAFDFHRLHASGSKFDESIPLKEAFASRGASLEVIAAPDASVGWGRFDAVLPLGCWGYHEDVQGFLAWVESLEAAGARLINAPALLRWNVDKAYLLRLQASGAHVAPFLHFEAHSRPDLGHAIEAEGWSRFVLKPTISANAWKTLVADAPPGSEATQLAEDILRTSGLLVQPFFEEIPRHGELSILFFGGKLSHAVVKLPRAGDFRSQPSHGASVLRAELPPTVLERAKAVLRAVPGEPVYARVDGFLRDGEFQLVELELIEPYLFLDGAPPEACGRFCDAVLQHLQAR